MGRPRKIKSPEKMEELWGKYKEYCDSYTVVIYEFSPEQEMIISKKLSKPITCTIEGFCRYISLSRSAFYKTYGSDKVFSDTVTRAREECEVDARTKFETGQIPHQLAALWMGNYGYGTNTNNKVNSKGRVSVIIYSGDELEQPS